VGQGFNTDICRHVGQGFSPDLQHYNPAVVIKASSAGEIRRLIGALDGADPIAREAAIARLGVIGARAVDPLLEVVRAARTPASAGAAMQALDAIGDPRAIPAAKDALASTDASLFRAAAALLRSFVSSADAPSASAALDALIAAALDPSRPSAVRSAALEALQDLPPQFIEPVRRALARDPDLASTRETSSAAVPIDQVWRDAIAGRLPDSPVAMKTALARHAASAPLTQLQRLVDALRAREQGEKDAAVRAEWQAVRGQVHQGLASRGSRVALYDLRESLLAEGPLPVAFLAAIEEVGDAGCLEPLAAAYDASSRTGDAWWREHVASAFRAIVQREGLTRRHTAVKRVLSRWPDAAAALMAKS
jgi:hypothetical protein